MLFLPFQSAVKLTYKRSNFHFFSSVKSRTPTSAPKAKSQLRHCMGPNVAIGWVNPWV